MLAVWSFQCTVLTTPQSSLKISPMSRGKNAQTLTV
jgi:hypothetical protein